VDGLKPVLEKLVKSELFNTIIPGRLYPTRTSHGKILELRVCKSPSSHTASAGLDDWKNSENVRCSDLKRTSNHHSYKDTEIDYHATVRKRNEDEHAKYMKRYQLPSLSENVKGNKYGDNVSTRSDKTSDSINNNSSYNNRGNNSSSNKNSNDSSRNRGSMTESCGISNDKTTHKVLARNGSLIQEVQTSSFYRLTQLSMPTSP
jgi:hypothetical protein